MPSRIQVQTKSQKQLGRYAGEWVVFVGNKIAAHNRNLRTAMAQAKKKYPQKKPSAFLVPRKDEGPYVLAIV